MLAFKSYPEMSRYDNIIWDNNNIKIIIKLDVLNRQRYMPTNTYYQDDPQAYLGSFKRYGFDILMTLISPSIHVP